LVSSENERLDSWKSIAAYFGRSVRTVQNWERTEGLPVHRHQHKKLGSVFALRAELDAWWSVQEQQVDRPPLQSVSTRTTLLAGALLGAAGLLYFAMASSDTPAVHDDSRSRSPQGDAIVYHSDENGNFDIWVAPVRGGRATNLTQDHPGLDKHPTWSPDGKRIAFYSEREGGGYFTVSPGGGPVQRLSPRDPSKAVVELGRPVWSPDGSELAWWVQSRSELSIEIHSIVDGLVHAFPIPSDSRWRLDLEWSPDGRALSFHQERKGSVDLEKRD
jgi:dipeptidyl aminopeptidase/acylaminoacyl peptidase